MLVSSEVSNVVGIIDMRQDSTGSLVKVHVKNGKATNPIHKDRDM